MLFYVVNQIKGGYITMKRFFLLMTLFCLCFAQISANEHSSNEYKKNEISFKLGMFPAAESIVGTFSSVFFSIGDSLSNNEKNGTSELLPLPTVSVEYLRKVADKHAIGVSASFGAPTLYSYETNSTKKNASIMYTSVMFKWRGYYMQRNLLSLYGGLGIGAEVFFANGDNGGLLTPFVSFQVTPIGVKIGNDTFFGTMECTVGSEGSLLTIGGGINF